MKEDYLLAFDIGSTGCKTCLYRLTDTLSLIDSALSEYCMISVGSDGVEQNPEDWWQAMCQTTATIMAGHEGLILSGISFCAQMQGLVLVDDNSIVPQFHHFPLLMHKNLANHSPYQYNWNYYLLMYYLKNYH